MQIKSQNFERACTRTTVLYILACTCIKSYLILLFLLQIIEGRASVTYSQYDRAITKVFSQASSEFDEDPRVKPHDESELKRYQIYSTISILCLFKLGM